MTVYVVVEVGFTVIEAVVSVVFHRYVPPPEAVRVTGSPEQTVPSLLVIPEVSATLIEAVGRAFTTIAWLVVVEQLFALVTITMYVVVAVGDTVIEAVVSRVLHR